MDGVIVKVGVEECNPGQLVVFRGPPVIVSRASNHSFYFYVASKKTIKEYLELRWTRLLAPKEVALWQD
jgi:hypothetical protein